MSTLSPAGGAQRTSSTAVPHPLRERQPLLQAEGDVVETGSQGPERQSNPTDRLVRILGLMSAHPTQRFTVTQLANALDLSKATCLGIVNSLARSGYLVRNDADKTYGLGPALLSLGAAAERAFGSLEIAKPFVEAFHRETGLTCTICGLVGNNVVVLAIASDQDEPQLVDRHTVRGVREIPGPVRVAEAFPLDAPTGLSYAAWLREEEVERWLRRVSDSPAQEATLRAQAVAAREQGYVVGRLVGMWALSADLLAQLDHPSAPQEAVRAVQDLVVRLDRYYVAADLDATEPLPVGYISAPIYDQLGRMELLVGLLVGSRQADPAQVRRWGEAAAACGRAATAAIAEAIPVFDAAAKESKR